MALCELYNTFYFAVKFVWLTIFRRKKLIKLKKAKGKTIPKNPGVKKIKYVLN